MHTPPLGMDEEGGFPLPIDLGSKTAGPRDACGMPTRSTMARLAPPVEIGGLQTESGSIRKGPQARASPRGLRDEQEIHRRALGRDPAASRRQGPGRDQAREAKNCSGCSSGTKRFRHRHVPLPDPPDAVPWRKEPHKITIKQSASGGVASRAKGGITTRGAMLFAIVDRLESADEWNFPGNHCQRLRARCGDVIRIEPLSLSFYPRAGTSARARRRS